MPKSAKRKREKAADFTKAKFKLGKGKKQPTNATDTSFKARSIALPGQASISRALVDGDSDEPRTSLGLGLDDVLARLRHPNAGVRKDSLASIKDLLVSEPTREVGKILRGLGVVISDEDTAVRKTLLGLFAWYLPLIPEETLSPHLPLLLLQTSSALSHIFPEIRITGCQLVSLLLDHIPSHVIGSWPFSSSGTNVLEGLRLAAGLGGETGSNSSIRLTPGAKLVTLRTLLSFVQKALTPHDSNEIGNISSAWLDEPLRSRKGKEKAIGDFPLFHLGEVGHIAGTCVWCLDVVPASEWELGRMAMDVPSDDVAVVSSLSALYIQVQPLLQTTFLEAAPQAFSPSTTSLTPVGSLEQSLDLCLVSASMTHVLARAIFSHNSPAPLKVTEGVIDFIKRMTPYFPFKPFHSGTTKDNDAHFQLSLTYASLVMLLAPKPPLLRLKGRREGEGRKEAVEEAWNTMTKQIRKGRSEALDEVAEWVIDCLAPRQDLLQPLLTPSSYSSLLPIIWSLLILPPTSSDIPNLVGTALLKHLQRVSSSSPIRTKGDNFLFHLTKVHEPPYPILPFYFPLDSPLRPLMRTWVESLPKVLWELGTKDDIATRGIVTFLLEMGLKGQGKSFNTISSKLGPFFHLQHPTKGSIPGPWSKLPNTTAKLAWDMATTWIEWDTSRTLQSAMNRAVEEKKHVA
ncbi:hypothetical protein TREMEDRAFT_67469 [Tremella mesenterica DSM 1558]|uniref:uncharacterized protein n=1 Tax=Tremella mesenterica (strain ATCC 24925 / CBS 8224 / DSM 1558 / NBRC 9311 / NRRL Y-6157 / RJB 2259-6 / UBC 559-6) TaxID=578456 RepID=UPI0003F4977B|nr:uncharacterized protein TREMEDRAFT_67469 [Tremella mesenterica DSM 1558]EIW73638.1 hypothetical protein TREMEDRAFT_67469 [Tremella mesenterica DSM 1558]